MRIAPLVTTPLGLGVLVVRMREMCAERTGMTTGLWEGDGTDTELSNGGRVMVRTFALRTANWNAGSDMTRRGYGKDIRVTYVTVT